MFSLKVIDTDSFLEMSPTAQLLYFHLSMRADDDGFVSSPKKIMKMANVPEDDMRVLIAKRYIIPFETGICVIKDWKIHNYIQSDRYQTTQYLKEKSVLSEDENGAYTVMDTECIQNVSKVLPQVRLELGKSKDRLGKDNTHTSDDNSLEYLSHVPESDMSDFTNRFIASEKEIKNKAESLKLYCKSKGKKYKDYKAFLLNALKRDFKERSLSENKYDKYENNK